MRFSALVFFVLWVDARAESLIAEGAELAEIASGFATVEGPLCDGKGTLYFTDIPNEHIWALDTVSLEKRLHVFELVNGEAGEGRVFAEVEEASDYGCDGMAMDDRGNLYCAGPHAVRVWNPEGELLETIAMPESPTNCAFAGKGSSMLYITGRTSVYRIEMKAAGVR